MPMYQYQCLSCGHEVEHLVAMAYRDMIDLVCVKCGGGLKRTVTAANFGKPDHRTQAILPGGKKVSGTWEK